MKNQLRIALLFFAGVIFLSGCVSNDSTDSTDFAEKKNDQLKVYATIFPLEDFAKKIGGKYVDVVSIYPPGAEAHTFEPTTKTMVDIANADVFLYSGTRLEGFVESAVEALQNEKVKSVSGTNGIALLKEIHEDEEEINEEEEELDVDPHAWIDPVLTINIAENIKNTFIELMPNKQETFENNFNDLKLSLENLDQQFKNLVNDVEDPKILVSHAAFGYWEKRYGIKQISISGISPTNEPSQKQLESIIETARENKINYIIFEQNITPKIAEIVQNEIGAQSLLLNNLAVVTDKDAANNEDYFSIMQRNLETLEKAFQ